MLSRTLALLIAVFAFVEIGTAADKKAAVSAQQLLADTIAHPGSFNQICDAPDPINPAIPLPIYGTILAREVNLSAEKLHALRARREEVIPALKKLLDSIDPAKPAPKVPPMKLKETPEGDVPEEVENSGISPRQISGLTLEIVRGLRAAEVLPELLALEERLRAALERASNDPKVEPPSVAKDGSIVFPRGAAKLSKRDEKMALGRVVQRELLSLMLDILRMERFPPLLKSEFEQTYAEAIKARANEEDLRAIKTPADAKAKGEEGLEFDPIYNIPLGRLAKLPAVPFSRDVREKIRALAKAYADNPPRMEPMTEVK